VFYRSDDGYGKGLFVLSGHVLQVEVVLFGSCIEDVWVDDGIDLKCELMGLGVECFLGDKGRGEGIEGSLVECG
jgi:hypothetical protein